MTKPRFDQDYDSAKKALLEAGYTCYRHACHGDEHDPDCPFVSTSNAIWALALKVEELHESDEALLRAQEEADALRSRVEALEGALRRADLFFELTCNTLEEMLGDDVPEDRQREVCQGMIAAIRDYDRARAALQPDKGERGPSYHRVEGAFRSEAP